MNIEKKQRLLKLLKQYTMEDFNHHKELDDDIMYFQKIGVNKIFNSVIKLINKKLKDYNKDISLDYKMVCEDVTKYYLVNKDKTEIENSKLYINTPKKLQSSLWWSLNGFESIFIDVDYGWKDVVPYVQLEAPGLRGGGTFTFEQGKSKQMVNQIEKILLKSVNDVCNNILKIIKQSNN